MRRLFATVALLSSSLFVSCESTTDFGYYVDQFDDDSIYLFFEIADQSVLRADFATYSGLLAPNYSTYDQTDSFRTAMNRMEYLQFVDELFDSAEFQIMKTVITDITFAPDGQSAEVRFQQELKYERYGNTNHSTSLYESVVGFEDGWIFLEKETRIAEQIIEE